MVVSICTINVNDIAEVLKPQKLFNYLLDKHFDIYLLQQAVLDTVHVTSIDQSYPSFKGSTSGQFCPGVF